METKDLQLRLFGTLLLFALLGVILSAALYPTAWGLFVFLPYILLPIIAAACSALGNSDDMSVWTNFGCFFESFFWVSAFAIPSLLYRATAINGAQLAWLLSSDVLIFISFLGISWIHADLDY